MASASVGAARPVSGRTWPRPRSKRRARTPPSTVPARSTGAPQMARLPSSSRCWRRRRRTGARRRRRRTRGRRRSSTPSWAASSIRRRCASGVRATATAATGARWTRRLAASRAFAWPRWATALQSRALRLAAPPTAYSASLGTRCLRVRGSLQVPTSGARHHRPVTRGTTASPASRCSRRACSASQERRRLDWRALPNLT
mmetsp:Transcript_20198/g.63317  ORF Transcript_20198/g.63317 Transcript_20198/m.63317 type:complete len:201 (+) Transcript_20198:405-1007(+)